MKALIYAIVFTFSFSSYSATGWKKILSEDGIQVFSKSDPNSKFFRFMGRGVILARPSKVFAIIQDVSKMTKWVEGTQNVKLLDKNFTAESYDGNIADFYQVFYAQSRTPWPFQTRDYILKGNVDYDPIQDIAVIRLRNVNLKSHPPKSGLTRMKFMRVNFRIKSIHEGKHSYVEFIVHLDPGGFIPAWAVNFMAKKEPIKTIRNLRKLAAGDDYDKKIEQLTLYHIKKLKKKARLDSAIRGK